MKKRTDVILLERVKRLGSMGDIVSVAVGFSRNYLVPQNKALPVTEESKARFAEEKATRVKENEKRQAAAEALSNKLKGKIVKMHRPCSASGRLYAAVTSKDIFNHLVEDMGLKEMEKSFITLTTTIKEVGNSVFKVEPYPDVIVDVDLHILPMEPLNLDQREAQEEKVDSVSHHDSNSEKTDQDALNTNENQSEEAA